MHSLYVGKNKFNIAKINSQYLLELYLNYNVYGFLIQPQKMEVR